MLLRRYAPAALDGRTEYSRASRRRVSVPLAGRFRGPFGLYFAPLRCRCQFTRQWLNGKQVRHRASGPNSCAAPATVSEHGRATDATVGPKPTGRRRTRDARASRLTSPDTGLRQLQRTFRGGRIGARLPGSRFTLHGCSDPIDRHGVRRARRKPGRIQE